MSGTSSKVESKPATMQTDLVLRNQELQQKVYEGGRKITGILVAALVASCVANAFLVWLAFFHFPVQGFVATSNAAAVCNVAPVSEPFIHHQTVADFATDAVIGIYTYDHKNYRRQITDATNKYFSSDYRDGFLAAFGDSANLRTVIDNFYIVSASTAGRPAQIIKNGTRKGAYFWQIQVPINVYYTAGRRTQEEKLLAVVDVTRTTPSPINPRGIAVSGINVSQLVN